MLMEHRVYKGVWKERGGVYLPFQLERTPATLSVMVDIVKGGGREPTPAWADFSIRWNVRQKVAVATLLVYSMELQSINNIT
jgi:hypothetical protein